MNPPRYLELQLLAILDDGPRHGYALRGELRRRSGGAFDPLPGTLYPLLQRLETAGQVSGSWQPGERRPRRVYRLTDEGRGELARQLADWAEFVGAVTAVLGG